MISSAFALKNSNIIPDYLTGNPETKLEQNYYVNSTLDFLSECNKELLDCRKDFYRTVLEDYDNNPYMVQESYNTVLAVIKSIGKKILAYIESLIARFITQLSKYAESDRYILKMKKQIEKFPNNETFKIEGFKYTFEENVPVINVIDLDLNDIESKLRSKGDVVGRLNQLYAISNDISSENNMNEIRGHILNLKYPISEVEFTDKVRSTFRNGQSKAEPIIVGKAQVSQALEEFENYKDMIKDAKRIRQNIKNEYALIETRINNIMDESNKVKDEDSETVANFKECVNQLVSKLVEIIRKISSLHAFAISAKIDAYTESYLQDRSILYKSLDVIQRDLGNTYTMSESYEDDYTRRCIDKSYIFENYFLNKQQERFVQECLLLSESNIPELKTIHEDLKMDVKNKFDKLVAILKDIYQKFMTKMKSLINDSKEFLTKNKDAFAKKVAEFILNNLPDYETGIKNIEGHKLQRLDIKTMVSDSELDIQKKLLPEYTGDGDFAEFAKRYFLCGNKPNREKVSSNSLNMGDIYAFCLGAENQLARLNNDLNDFNNAASNAKNSVSASIKTESVNEFGRRLYYSRVLESYVNEEGEQETEKADSKADLKLDVPSQDDKSKEEPKETNKQDDTTKTEEKPSDNGETKKLEETAGWYLKTARTILTAKITAFQKIYSEYMKILKYHVKMVSGPTQTAGKFTDEDQANIKNAMKEYNDAKDENGKKAAADKIINIYKSKNMNIDAHDVQTLVSKNQSKLS